MPLHDYLAEEVVDSEGPEVRELLSRAALFDRFTPELCEALGVPDAGDLLTDLARRGLFLAARREVHGWYALTDLVRTFALEHLAVPDPSAMYAAAADWFLDRGFREEAVRALVASGDPIPLAAALRTNGPALLASGAVGTVAEAAAAIPEPLRDAAIDQLDGQARQIRGDWEGALRLFDRAAAGSDVLPSGLAWRMGLIHHLRGDLERAVVEYSRGRVDGSDPRNEAVLLSWTATAHWLRGRAKECREFGERAMESAARSGDPGALAASHTVLAMLAALEGDRAANDAHYLQALDAAEEAGDVLQILRIRVNRSSLFNEEGHHAEALKELEIAIPLAELTGFAAFLALGLNNRAEARFRLGRLEEALADFQTARDVYQRLGSLAVSYPLTGMGAIYRERGDTAQARAAYGEAAELAERAGDAQGLVPALAGLARVVVPDDPEEAVRLADRAVEAGFGMAAVQAFLAKGWVALARGDHGTATEAADRAAVTAGERRDRVGLAEALELRALSSEDRVRAAEWAEEALAIWTEVGNPLGRARGGLILARLARTPAARAEAVRAEEELSRLGVRVRRHAPAGPVAFLAREDGAPVAIQTLGGFRLLRAGTAVTQSEWQSKKARDLLKVLVARRGVPIPRDVLMETLWPEEDPEKVSNRLSVAMSTVRGVLDPERIYEPEHFLAGDKESVHLDLEHMSVDIERFLADAGSALKLLGEGRTDEALPLLVSAQAAYGGDFLEEDLYEDWAVPPREQARAAYVAACRALARHAEAAGEVDDAVRYHLSILERDPYDEEAHLGVIRSQAAAGRHGEARRRYRMYVARMEDLGVEAAPFPA
jgi:DNA-binding SARP family transcriptional activator/ATP/maltotriose-dependent transcriptional regulator MalT